MCRSRKTDRAGVSDACRGRRAAVLYLYIFCKGERRGHRRAAGCASGYGSAGNYPGLRRVCAGSIREWPRSFPVRSYFPAADGGRRPFRGAPEKQGESRKRQPSRLLETTKKLPKEAEEFLAGVRMDWKNGSFALVKDQLYFLPEGVCAAKGLRYLRTGLSLGTVKKNRFEPSQALAAYLKKEEYVSCLTIPKGDDRVMRYLKGETLSFSEEECQGKKGWVLVCLDDFPLGWGKINNGTLKNKYYAGWRMV